MFRFDFLVVLYNALISASVDWIQARMIVNAIIPTNARIARDGWDIALKIRSLCYNPRDYGIKGKINDIRERLNNCNASWRYWNDFNAHKAGKTDGLDRFQYETKSSVGDWFTSEGTYERVIKTYSKKQTLLIWNFSYNDYNFRIVCTFAQLYEYLLTYNGNIETWLPKSKARYNDETKTTLLRMQEIKTSKKKMLFLMNCPYNMNR